MSQYQDLSGKKQYDFNYSREGRYRRSVPSNATIFRKKKAPLDRSNLRGKICPGCGLTRSMTNLCDCNS